MIGAVVRCAARRSTACASPSSPVSGRPTSAAPRPTGRTSPGSSSRAATRCASSRWATASRPSGPARSRSSRAGCRFRSATARWRCEARARPVRPTWSTQRRRTRPPQPPRPPRAGRSSRSSSPTPPTSARSATACSPARSRSSRERRRAPVRALKALRTRALRDGGDDRRSQRVPRRDRAAVGARTRAGARAHEPGAAAPGGRAGAARAGTFVFVGRLTRQKALGVAIEAVARVPARSSSSSVTGRSEPSSSASRQPRRVLRGSSFLGALHPRRDAAHRRRRRGGAPLERLGEPAPFGGGGAVGRSPRGLHGGRRCARGRERRGERLARAARRPGAAGGRDPSRPRGARPARPARCGGEAVRRGAVERVVYGKLEALSSEAVR